MSIAMPEAPTRPLIGLDEMPSLDEEVPCCWTWEHVACPNAATWGVIACCWKREELVCDTHKAAIISDIEAAEGAGMRVSCKLCNGTLHNEDLKWRKL